MLDALLDPPFDPRCSVTEGQALDDLVEKLEFGDWIGEGREATHIGIYLAERLEVDDLSWLLKLAFCREREKLADEMLQWRDTAPIKEWLKEKHADLIHDHRWKMHDDNDRANDHD